MMVGEKIRHWVFDRVHSGNLVYNACWEDPRCDRNLMEFDTDSEIVMITSAGCNALAYLADHPKNIHCIDVNPRQNALLQFKQALIRHTDHETLFGFFGKGTHPDHEAIYREKVRSDLGPYARMFWDKNIRYFSDKGVRKNFYHYGTSGMVAWFFSGYIRARKRLYNEVQKLLNATDLETQHDIYLRVEKKLMNRMVEAVVNRHFIMCMLGVPESQQELFVNDYYRGALGFIQERLRHVFTQLPIHDNYFYRVYINGEYTEACSPDYLKKENYDLLHQQVDKIHTYNTTISDFLKTNPGKYSHFILLDHQDWLAANDRRALEEEWALILANSRPGTRILLRSAAEKVDFFPDFVRERLTFETTNVNIQHQLDRVGTYASTYLGIVN
ncbi:MAG: BtaA family protein [Saprospiraceae bacterium]|nr:BtaA family protein [Saprospiraceae bacterium]MCB9326700.1 BtaA family protein [Lewinellaceae bacterium]